MNQERPVLVCLCHLHWRGVWQRPQHVLSRLSNDFDIIFHEEPFLHQEDYLAPYYERHDPQPNVVVLKPHIRSKQDSGDRWGYHPGNADAMAALLNDFLDREGYRNRPLVAWLYTPMAYPVAARLEPDVVAYDCMDELSLFRFAPREMRGLEEVLMRRADLVTCGGASMYRNRKDRHPNVHMLLSGVDRAHFEQASDPATTEPENLAGIPHPRIGYWGVLDERIDWDLLAEASQARPEWHWVLIGPFAKVEPDKLPQAPNLHYLGHQSYTDLPRYASGLDVAMMPFAMNDATRYISPTKTLEYMASGLPIVSTPVADVVNPYKGPVLVADDTKAFIDGIAYLLNEPEQSWACRLAAYNTWIERWSWDSIVATMRAELMKALGRTVATGK